MTTQQIIEATLEQAASDEKLFTRAYELLYQRHPQFEEMFVMDDDGSVRGSMLQTALEYILLYCEYNPNLQPQISGACSNHIGYGVEAKDFTIFFAIIRDCIKEVCADNWSDPQTTAWQKMLNDFEELIK